MLLESISSEAKKPSCNLRVIPEKKDPGYKSTIGLHPLNKNICKKTFPASYYRNTSGLIRKDADMASLNKSLLEKFFDTLKPLGKKLGKVLRFIK